MTLDDDRARLAQIRDDHLYDVDLGRWDDDETWLLRMAEDGIRARAALADVEALCAAARAGLSIPPIDCTNSCSDGPCDCSGLFRVRAWDLDPDAVRTAIRDALEAR